ncbi:tRNA uridine-5-carboxymethylaminomethyl(34) synthesis GTPase MnmE [Desulfobacca acetoxidans]|uniref:tRNA modification GTPase MnmE n=1 Tax=Desulfobacca acetoxidans (strain ATCC 700848 / DSM 11109 / ASRB2) TaxID=880072 RepID=F2NGV5_DESAR|nr:tRNA uridine-5-carboxymethylaminomethyl(34) synthesis GTPase MnmE [Desulfobacca acetoxidans]AEB08726.1 tRNA modification GTPase mnmE [Desulfobacca acetoxidans DSM 11109]
MKRHTIAAISTPPGEGGIGIVRLSGPDSRAIADRIFRPARPHTPTWPARRLILGQIVSPEDGQAVDEVLLAFMPRPHSYTREDVIEIQCHSGYAVLQRILQLTLQAGARLADPGEFTLRAFLSGRLDLTQAEAVLEVIQARSDASLRVAAAHLAGGLGRHLTRLRDDLLDLLALVEADLDFGEEVPEIDLAALVHQLEALESEITALCQSYAQGRMLRQGLQVVLAGRPNVGKSSLLNRLLQTDRAIVTDIPGTTRDVIAENLVIQGLPVCLLDTAGLRPAQNLVEEIGIQRTQEHLQQADLVLYLLDASQPWQVEDEPQLQALRDQSILVVLNKIDLPRVLQPAAIPSAWPHHLIEISALTGEGIPALKEAIFQAGMGGASPLDGQIVTQARHCRHLEHCRHHLQGAWKIIQTAQPRELLALELRSALQELSAILGLEVDDEVLDRVFARFCLGK